MEVPEDESSGIRPRKSYAGIVTTIAKIARDSDASRIANNCNKNCKFQPLIRIYSVTNYPTD
jgi:hypothetical protein